MSFIAAADRAEPFDGLRLELAQVRSHREVAFGHLVAPARDGRGIQARPRIAREADALNPAA